MKATTFCILVFLSSSASADMQTNWIPPYDDYIYRQLSGVWSESQVKPSAAIGVAGEFSWGTSYYIPNDSILIDLHAKKPFLKLAGGFFEILSIDKMDETSYKLNIKTIVSDAKSGYIVVHVLRENRIRFEDHLIPAGFMGFLFERPMVKYYGPTIAGQK